MKKHAMRHESKLCYILVGILALLCFLPLWTCFSVSISNEKEVAARGFSLLPYSPTLDNYRFVFTNKGSMILQAFGVSFLVMAAGTVYSLFIMTTYAYAIAQKKETFRFAGALSFFAWLTTVFSGGVLPWYILTTKYYGLQNNLWALFIPYGMNVFYMFILRNNFRSVPEELIEAAKIDAASNARIFFSIMLPLSRVGLVTVTMFMVLQYWNDFHLSLYLITKTDLFTVQKLLYNMISNISALLSKSSSMASAAEHVDVPSNTARMVLTMMTVLPIAAIYPFSQKYFIKGMTVGAVKG